MIIKHFSSNFQVNNQIKSWSYSSYIFQEEISDRNYLFKHNPSQFKKG